ncbi:hypothetical protein ACJW31_01G280300 [Castanea mollissima]
MQNPTSDSQPIVPNSAYFANSHRYAFRILSSRMTPSITPDAAAIAESIKCRLATQGKSSEALTFADLYSKFASKTGPGSVNNKWAVLYLLKIIAHDKNSARTQLLDSSVLLPNLSDLRVSSRKQKGWENGVLLVSRQSSEGGGGLHGEQERRGSLPLVNSVSLSLSLTFSLSLSQSYTG